MKKLKKKKKKQPLHPKTICPNCGEPGPHFVPPSFGDKGFFICKQNSKYNKLRRNKNMSSDEQTIKCPICGRPYKVYSCTTADQSACPKCVMEAEKSGFLTGSNRLDLLPKPSRYKN